VSDERLKGESGGDANGESGVRHAVENVSVNADEVILVLEVELLKLLDDVASSRTKEALGAGEIGEDVAHKEIFHLVRNRALLAENNGRKGSNHAQRTLLGDVVLLVVRRLLVFCDDGINKLENLERLLPPRLGQADKEVGSGNIGGGSLLKVIELPMKVLLGLILELLEILLRQADNREDKVGNEGVKMRLQVGPHFLGSHTLVKEDEGIRKTRSAKPRGLGNPFLDLLEVFLKNFWSNPNNELLGEPENIGVGGFRKRRGISVSTPGVGLAPSKCHMKCASARTDLPNKESVKVKVRPFLRLPPTMLLALVRVLFDHGDSRNGLGDGVEENGAPGDVVIALSQER